MDSWDVQFDLSKAEAPGKLLLVNDVWVQAPSVMAGTDLVILHILLPDLSFSAVASERTFARPFGQHQVGLPLDLMAGEDVLAFALG